MLVLERIESSGEQDIRFVFPAGEHEGEHYAASLSFCPNPVCGCGILDLSVVRDTSEEAGDASRPEFRFSVDILEQKLDTANAEASTYGKNLGRAFVSHLERPDWALLHELYYLHKRQLTDTTPDAQLDTYFPSSEIERDGAMVGFREILPFSEYRTLDLDGKRHVLDDQHCVRPGCECTEIVVSLLDEQVRNPETAPSEYPTIFIDYATGRWRVVVGGGANPGFLERFAKEMKSGDYPAWFRKRHSRLKSLYRLYKQRHGQPAASRSSSGKVGRNDPCPCGSGKKYKKCCLGMQ